MKLIHIVILATVLSGCNTLSYEGKTQQVNVLTTPERASCKLVIGTHERQVYTPATVTLPLSSENLNVFCYTPKLKGAKAYKANLNGTYDAIINVNLKGE